MSDEFAAARKASRLHYLADGIAFAAVRHTGIPWDEANAAGLARDCYLAARKLLEEGERAEAALTGAESGGPA